MRNVNWLFVFRLPPAEQGVTEDALDLLLVAAAFGVSLQVLFIGDGVQHIAKVLDAKAEPLPRYTKTFRALSDFEIEQRYVLQDSLQELNLSATDLTIKAEIVDARKLRTLLNTAQQVFHF